MEDNTNEKIIKNMKEVLKKTRKSKHKKPRSQESKNDGDDVISEILSEKWNFTSPPAQQKQPEDVASPKVNIFERMMSKKPEPLAQLSPEVNGIKKKRKYTKKAKNNKVETDNESEDSMGEENNAVNLKNCESPVKGIQKLFNGKEKLNESLVLSRKRNRAVDTPTPSQESEPMTPVDNANKKRKMKVEKMLLDSNENSIELEVITPTYSSGRPRRSCAGNVNYEHLISPEKAKEKESPESSKRKPRKKNDDDEFTVLEIDDDSPVKPKKLAPLFVKKMPKPSIDPALREARRNFLLSGLPEDMRNNIDKQKQLEDEILGNELIAFPLVSHVTQLSEVKEVVEDLKGKSRVKIKEEEEVEVEIVKRLLVRGQLTEGDNGEVTKVVLNPRKPNKHVKEHVKQLKEEFENFPTYRVMKQLHRKFQQEQPDDENLLFVDIFKPLSFNEFHVNLQPVKALQKFLLTWNEKVDDDSDDSSSRLSSKSMNNFTVLTGGNGTGKTSAVYALAKDLNYQVIEINAGSRRSGKKMLQDLLEATQSHRVKNNEGENSQDIEAKSIILIEDAELVFESDDGFVASIQQLINISKRPVVLTTNSRNCHHLQKFIAHNEIVFEASTHHVGKYLSLLCLSANYQITAVAIEHLYALNGRDLRKTINEIEFFIRSGATTNDGNLVEFYERKRREGQQIEGNKNLETLHFESSIASSFGSRREKADDDETSHQQRNLTDEMGEFLVGRCNAMEIQRDLVEGKQKIIESSISSDLISQPTNLNSMKTLALDFSPILRDICRSEKVRCTSGRRTTANNRGHYLRFLIAQNSFGNDYFNEQCEIFQRQ